MFNWASFLPFSLTTAFTPGPNTITSMSCAARHGFRKTLPFALGVMTAQTLLVQLCAVFFSALSAAVPNLELPMKIIGAAYMLYLAYKTFKAPAQLAENDKADYGFVSGMLLQLVNPKLYLFCFVSLQSYILPVYGGNWLAVAAYAELLVLICFASVLSWAAFGSAFQRLFSKHAKATRLITAGLLVYCAVSLLL